MGFQYPQLLLLLLLLPVLAWVYRFWRLKAGASSHALHSNLRRLSEVAGPRKRHWGSGLYLLALVLGMFTLARPQAMMPQPDNLAGVVLTIDISRSMRATDIEPNRMTAAKRAAQSFIRSLPDGAKVGLVTFAGYATLNAPLTTDHQRVIEIIEGLEMARRTAIGEGLLESMKAIPVDSDGKPLGPASVVLLSDGRSNTGVDALSVVKQAKEMGVVVHTIGLGKRLSDEQSQFNNFMAFDEETLQAIAESTGGQYYAAESAEALNTAYRKLGRVVGWKPARTEVSGLSGLLAGLALASSLVLSGLGRKVL